MKEAAKEQQEAEEKKRTWREKNSCKWYVERLIYSI